MMMGLRLAEGVEDARFRARFGVGLETIFGAELAQLQGLGLLAWGGHAARLTARGRLLGNQVFMCFL
jgi:oxygen-independent coproporphyrinogen-3 oxidase